MSEIWHKPGTKRLAKGWKYVKGEDEPVWVGDGPDPRKVVKQKTAAKKKAVAKKEESKEPEPAPRKFLPKHLR